MRKFRSTEIITAFAFLLSVALTLLPELPLVRSIYPPNPRPKFQLELLTTLLGIEFTIVIGLFGLDSLTRRNDDAKFRDGLLALAPAYTRALGDEDFYTHFLYHAERAEHSVSIAYFAPYPPMGPNSRGRDRYYRDIERVVRKQCRVRFRRLVRITKENESWIARLLERHNGCANAYVAVIADEDDQAMPLALSTQLVDHDKVWLVAIATHEKADKYRDLYIESAAVSGMLMQYYERLWAKATVLLEAGVITPEGEILAIKVKQSGTKND